MDNCGKNKRKQLTCLDEIHNVILTVDSQEEIDSLNWFVEAISLSVINDFAYQPPPYQLFDSQKYVDVTGKERTLFREHIYTPDWVISFCPSSQLSLSKEMKVPYSELSNSECSVYIDSKGSFNAQERSFSYNQKWTWQRFGIYIYKLVPKVFFKKFGVPLKCWYTTKTKKARKMFSGFKSIKEMLGITH